MKLSYPLFLASICWLFFSMFSHADEPNANNSTPNTETAIDEIIAIVNEDIVLASQLQERSQAVYQQAQQQGKQTPPPNILVPQVLERLIIESLQLQLAERVGMTIQAQEMQNALANIAKQNKIPLSQLKKSIEADGLSFETFQKSIEHEMLLQRIQQAAVTKRIDITEQDITDFLNSEEGKLSSSDAYHLAHIILPLPNDATDIMRVKAQAQQLIQSSRNGKDFSQLAKQHSASPNSINGGDLGWRAKKDLPSLYANIVPSMKINEISEPILANDAIHIIKLLGQQGKQERWVSQTHVRHILVSPSAIRNNQETATFLKELRAQILSGDDFAEVAKKHSGDYGSALKGGDLGWTTPGQMVAQFEQIMKNSSPNVISKPFQSQYGWHILEVLERRQEDMSEMLIRKSIHNLLTQRQYELELPLWLQELRAEAYVVIKDPSLISPSSD